MRYAIFSDIQGNRQAWEAVRADMEELGIQLPVCLGDVVGVGPEPREVLRSVQDRVSNIVMGDCDAAVAGLSDLSAVEPGIREAIEWTRAQLDDESLEFLAELSPAITRVPLRFVHAESVQPRRFGCIDRLDAAKAIFDDPAGSHVAFVGHGCGPAIFRLNENGTVEELPAVDCQLDPNRRYIVNVGSVGDPATPGDVRASYVFYDDSAQVLNFRRVAFDLDAYRRKLTAVGLPLRPWLGTGAVHPAGAPRAATGPIAIGAVPPMGGQGMVASPGDVSHPAAAGPMITRAPAPALVPSRNTGLVALVTGLLIVVGLMLVASVVAAWKLRDHWMPRESLAAAPGPPVEQSSAPAPIKARPAEVEADPNVVRGADAGAMAEAAAVSSRSEPPVPAPPGQDPGPAPDPEMEPPAVVNVPEPAAVPDPDPDAEPQPAAAHPAGPAPIPPEPANAAAAAPMDSGLLFYAPFDEGGDSLTARDVAGGRELNVSGGLPGALGRVGFACHLGRENDSKALVSEAKPMPEMKAITIAFWIRRPDAPAPATDDPEAASGADGGATPGEAEAPPPAEPPMNLVSIREFCEVRLEDGEVVANLDRQGAPARVAVPPDYRWHHVLVENGEGSTRIWIDHRTPSDPVSENLAAAPAGGVVQIGNDGANFLIDELAIWNRRFSPDERTILYRLGRLDQPIRSPLREIAYWRFEDEIGSRRIGDAAGGHPLGAYKFWSPLPGIAPDPVPLTRSANSQAAQVWKLGVRREDAGSFQMKAGVSFTYEGWMKLSSGSAVTLGGTLPADPDESLAGWRLEVRPARGVNGFMAFIYQNGSAAVQALAREVPVYDGRSHHFAAVWNALSTPGHGVMELYLDNKKVAGASLPLPDLDSSSMEPFGIVARHAPVGLDELRFSLGALEPGEFLTRGEADPDPALAAAPAPGKPDDSLEPLEGESVMQRLAREARERRARQQIERDRQREADEVKRKKTRVGD